VISRDELRVRGKSLLEKAYSPYSHLRVGAFLIAESGEVFPGVNVENVSYGLTICAERSALTGAISRGVQKFAMLYLISDYPDRHITPCGACLQVLSEFCASDMPVVCENLNGDSKEYMLLDLIPHAFTF